MLRGWILDARVGCGGGATLTVSDGEARREVHLRAARFDMYLRPRLEGLVAHLLEHPDVNQDGSVDPEEEWYAPPWYTSTVKVAHLRFSSLRSLVEVGRRILSEGAAELYNTYPDALTRLFWSLGYPPTTLVETDGEGLVVAEEDPLGVDYAQPEWSCGELRLYGWYGEAFHPAGGDRPTHFDLYVWRRGEHFTVRGEPLGRLGSHRESLQGLDALSYPQAYRPLIIRELGFDPSTTPLLFDRRSPHSEGVREALVRVVEWSRVSYTPPRLLANASIGRPLTANEARFAWKRKWLIPQTNNRHERPRTLSELVEHDRGGIVFRPKPGVYFNVAQLDFSSMYPSLIVGWNISPETVDNPEAPGTRVPGTSHWVDDRRLGLVPEALGWLIHRRERLRGLHAQLGGEVFDIRQSAIKWLLVASFGYLGFRNAKFGKIEAYECVTALARWAAERAIREATRLGYRVLHVLVDSLFVQRADASPFQPGELENLMGALGRATRLKLKLEALYDWVVFSKNAHSERGSPQRYYGRLTPGGELKLKGLECVKSGAPLIVRRAQLEALEQLKQARTPRDFTQRLEDARRVFQHYMSLLADQPKTSLDPSLFTSCVRGARRALSQAADGWVWLIRTKRGFQTAHQAIGEIQTTHYLTLLETAWEQLRPENTERIGGGQGVV